MCLYYLKVNNCLLVSLVDPSHVYYFVYHFILAQAHNSHALSTNTAGRVTVNKILRTKSRLRLSMNIERLNHMNKVTFTLNLSFTILCDSCVTYHSTLDVILREYKVLI